MVTVPPSSADTIQACKDLLPIGTVMEFKSPMIVKKSPHQHIVTATGVIHSYEGKLFIVREDKSFNELLPNQFFIEYVAGTLYQRLKLLQTIQDALQPVIPVMITAEEIGGALVKTIEAQ